MGKEVKREWREAEHEWGIVNWRSNPVGHGRKILSSSYPPYYTQMCTMHTKPRNYIILVTLSAMSSPGHVLQYNQVVHTYIHAYK